MKKYSRTELYQLCKSGDVKQICEELYDTFGETFDEEQLFEHYVLIGKPNGWIAK